MQIIQGATQLRNTITQVLSWLITRYAMRWLNSTLLFLGPIGHLYLEVLDLSP